MRSKGVSALATAFPPGVEVQELRMPVQALRTRIVLRVGARGGKQTDKKSAGRNRCAIERGPHRSSPPGLLTTTARLRGTPPGGHQPGAQEQTVRSSPGLLGRTKVFREGLLNCFW